MGPQGDTRTWCVCFWSSNLWLRGGSQFLAVLLAMLVSTLPISLITTRFIMTVEPFWQPEQYSEPQVWDCYFVERMTCLIVPIAGMLVGSTISGMMVALTAVLKEVQENRDKVETYLAFGASRIEASIPIAQQALYIALTPVVNQMRCAYLYRRKCYGPS